MAWTKLDDGFWSNPKIVAAGNEAAGAYVRCLSYCGQHGTDGKVPIDVARFIARPKVLDQLLEVSLLEQNGSGYVIPDYLEFNPSAEKVAEERAAARDRMARIRSKGQRR